MKYLITVLLFASFSVLAEPLCESPVEDKKVLKNFPGLTQGADDWLFRAHDLLPKFGPHQVGLRGLETLNRLLAERGTKLIMVPVPTRALVHPEKLGGIDYDVLTGRAAYSEYLVRLRDQGIGVPSLDALFDYEGKASLFFARDHHWTSQGAREVAALVANEVKQQALIEAETTRFVTTRSGEASNLGSYSKAAQALCGVEFASENVEQFSTEGDIDLFAAESRVEIVLVGTSNSRGSLEYNFDGFLQEFIGHEIANLAQSGGGYGDALSDYLVSDAFIAHPPKILIWELPGYYSLNTAAFYTELTLAMESAL